MSRQDAGASSSNQWWVGVVIGLLVPFVYLKSQSVDYREQSQIIGGLEELTQLETVINDSVLEIETGLQSHYDEITSQLQTIKQQLQQFKDNLPEHLHEPLSDPLNIYTDGLFQKLELIEQFKSHRAIYLNSTRYLPKAVDNLISKLAEHEVAKNFNEELHDLVENIYLYQFTHEKNKLLAAAYAMEQLEALSEGLDQPLQEDLRLILRHGKLAIEYSKETQSLIRRIYNQPGKIHLKNIQSHYMALFEKEQQQAETFHLLLFILSGLLVLWILLTIMRLNRLSGELANKVVELNFQKYALDQHAIVSITDVQGNITYANQKFCEISGYLLEEVLGKNHRIIKSGEHSKDFFRELWRTIAKGDVWHGEVKNRRKDGSHYWVSATIVPFLDHKKKPFQYVSIRTDISNRKKAEAAALQARSEAENANRAKSEFLSRMSHELRTPLNAIIGFAQLLEMEPELGEEEKDSAREILKAGEHLLSLINEVLDLAKIEAGKVSLVMEKVDLSAIVNEAIILLETLANQHDITLQSSLPEIQIVWADNLRLKQVMLNLMSNAIKYNRPSGKVTISAEMHGPDNQQLRIIVADTGNGISEDKLDKLFSPFTRLDAENSHIQGTGIGLTITRNLIEMMGGTITAKSNIGEGSRFIIELNVSEVVEEREQQ